jgi:hypothetical protein
MRWSRLLFVVVFFSMLHAQDIPKQIERTVFLTHRKFWLASGGFDPSKGSIPPDKAAPDYIKDFRKQCPKIVVTDAQGKADYAVTIDFIGLFQPNALTFQVAVYSRNAGVIYMGGTNFLKNAIKDACNAIGTIK